MDGNSIKWEASKGDLFTLYHGVGTFTAPSALTGYENATYKAVATDGGPATLTTPSMIKPGRAIMVWPADTTFYTAASGNVTVKIPVELTNVEKNIPYVSDLITIGAYAPYSDAGATPTAYNTAGKDRKYPVYMRPMASQLTLKADYNGTDATLKTLEEGEDGIDPIALTSVDITDPATSLTQEIDLNFTTPTPTQGTNWGEVAHHAWTEVTGFDLGSAVGVGQLTTKCINGTESAKFLMLPQNNIGAAGLTGAAVVVNTTYGKVQIGGAGTAYTGGELGDAWYRYAAAGAGAGTYAETETATAGTGSDASKVMYTNNIEKGLAQVIDAFSGNTTTKATSLVVNEPTGAVGTRYVKVLLSHLDMSDLHVKKDKQLRDAARVWETMGLPSVTVLLDGGQEGDAPGEFTISQKTIETINAINARATGGKSFSVKPCTVTGEACTKIVITEGGAIKDLAFIKDNGGTQADVILKAGQNWSWTTNNVTITSVTKKAIKVGTGVQSIINEGTFASGAATIATCNAAAAAWTNTPFVNAKGAEWNVTAGDLTVQFDVTNYGTVKIASGAEYHQDIANSAATTFTNEAEDLPTRFGGDDAEIGKVENKGVFAVTGTGGIKGIINNYGLIEHAANAAKTYITTNELAGTTFATPFSATPTLRKIGRINLPYSNKDEDNISVSSALNSGFVSVTVTSSDAPATKKLNLTAVGDKVNYVIIKGGIDTVTEMTAAIKYIEFDAGTTEIAWQAGTSATPVTATYEGLIVLSPVNIKLYTNVVVNQATYLGAKMYVGGTFTNGTAGWAGYYGDTSDNVASKYITF